MLRPIAHPAQTTGSGGAGPVHAQSKAEAARPPQAASSIERAGVVQRQDLAEQIAKGLVQLAYAPINSPGDRFDAPQLPSGATLPLPGRDLEVFHPNALQGRGGLERVCNLWLAAARPDQVPVLLYSDPSGLELVGATINRLLSGSDHPGVRVQAYQVTAAGLRRKENAPTDRLEPPTAPTPREQQLDRRAQLMAEVSANWTCPGAIVGLIGLFIDPLGGSVAGALTGAAVYWGAKYLGLRADAERTGKSIREVKQEGRWVDPAVWGDVPLNSREYFEMAFGVTHTYADPASMRSGGLLEYVSESEARANMVRYVPVDRLIAAAEQDRGGGLTHVILNALGEIGAPEAVPLFRKMAEARDNWLRRYTLERPAARRALARTEGLAAIPFLLSVWNQGGAKRGGDPESIHEAFDAMPLPEAPALERLLTTQRPELRLTAALALAVRREPTCVPVLLEFAARTEAQDALRWLGDSRTVLGRVFRSDRVRQEAKLSALRAVTTPTDDLGGWVNAQQSRQIVEDLGKVARGRDPNAEEARFLLRHLQAGESSALFFL